MRPIVLRIAAALACAACIPGALAQGNARYPERAIGFVVPSGPGTGHDILARVLGPKLGEHWKVAVVTQNRVGATGNIGTEFVAKSAPDGYTLLCVGISFVTNAALNSRVPYDPVKSFVPVALLATSVMSVTVAPQFPARTFPEFIEAARRAPGKYFYASPGNGTAQHLGMELLKRELTVDLVHVPYKTSGPALAEVIGGQVQAMIVPLQTAAPHVNGGKLRMLAILSAERSAAFPDVPTVKELGYPGLEIMSWYGLFAPVATPGDISAKLNGEVNAILRESDVRELLAKQGLIAVGGPPERLGELVKTELARWARVVSAAGIRAD